MTETSKPIHTSTEILAEASHLDGNAYLFRHEFSMPEDMRYVIFELRYRPGKYGTWAIYYSSVSYHKNDSRKEERERSACNALLDGVSAKIQKREVPRAERVLMGLLYSDAIARGAEHGEPPF